MVNKGCKVSSVSTICIVSTLSIYNDGGGDGWVNNPLTPPRVLTKGQPTLFFGFYSKRTRNLTFEVKMSFFSVKC